MIDIIGTADQQAKFRRRIKQPVDQIAADVLDELGLHDAPYQFRIVLRGNASDVQEHFAAKYPGKKLNSHSYASRGGKECYISVEDVTQKSLAHELAHVALNQHYTTDKITQKLHELIAQAVEEKVCRKYSRWFW